MSRRHSKIFNSSKTNRRDFILSISALAALSPLAARQAIAEFFTRMEEDATESKPNFLFLSVDDLNDWIEPLENYPGIKTPHMSRLARMGVNFTRAYCAAPSCNPSRTATLFGVAPHRTKIYMNGDFWENSAVPLVRGFPGREINPEGIPSLPRRMKRGDYFSAGAGKVFHGGQREEWDEGAWGEKESTRVEVQALKHLERNKFKKDLAKFKKPPKSFDFGHHKSHDNPDDYNDRKIIDDWAARYHFGKIERTNPTFLALGIYRPHLKWIVPKQYFDNHPMGSFSTVPPGFWSEDHLDVPDEAVHRIKKKGIYPTDHNRIAKEKKWAKAIQAYLASVQFADDCVGMILDYLKDESSRINFKNTYIFFWSDHGWQLGEKLAWRKFTLWERATRVPLIISGPGIPKGKECSSIVSLLDLYPTIEDLAFGQVSDHHDGHSLKEILANPEAPMPERFAVSTWEEGNHSIRRGPWRLTRFRKRSSEGVPSGHHAYELYHREMDPYEFHNLMNIEVNDRLIAGGAKVPPHVKSSYDRVKSLAPEEINLALKQLNSLLEDYLN